MAEQRKRERPEDYFADWKEREALAEAMIPQVGAMARARNVKCYIYGHSLVNQSERRGWERLWEEDRSNAPPGAHKLQ